MNIKEFQETSKRTMNKELNLEETISNMVFGLVGETGEVVDALKKGMFQGHMIDRNNLVEEMGDIMFYIVNLASVLGLSMEDILEHNHQKLLKRFPEGFNIEDSINRKDQKVSTKDQKVGTKEQTEGVE